MQFVRPYGSGMYIWTGLIAVLHFVVTNHSLCTLCLEHIDLQQVEQNKDVGEYSQGGHECQSYSFAETKVSILMQKLMFTRCLQDII